MKTLTDINTFSNSRLNVIRSCYRKYYLSYILGWTREGFSPAPAFGKAFHDALDNFFNCLKNNEKHYAFNDTLEELPEIWENSGLPTDPFEQDSLGFRNYENLVAILTHWYDSNLNWLELIEPIASEKEFIVDFQDLNFLIGKLDLVYRLKADGKIYILEHKTSSSYAKDYGLQYKAIHNWQDDPQVHQYAYAGRMLYGSDFGGITMNLNLVHKTVRKTIRQPILFIDESLEDWYNATQFYINQVLPGELITNENAWTNNFPKNQSTCWGMYGSCPYLNICRTCLPIESFDKDSIPEGFIQKDGSKGLIISDEMKMEILKRYNRDEK